MDARTRQQEMRYGQALGYAFAMKDGRSERRDAITDSGAFATFYAMLKDLGGHDRTLSDAYDYFSRLSQDEQRAYGTEWMRVAYSPFDECTRMGHIK